MWITLLLQKCSKKKLFFFERKKRKTTNKEKNDCVSWVKFLIVFFCQRFLQNERFSIERIFKRPGSFDCQKKFNNSVYGEHVIETFSFVFVSKIKFPSRRQFAQKILSRLVEKISQQYVLTLVDCFFVTTSFDLWMFKGAYDVFFISDQIFG